MVIPTQYNDYYGRADCIDVVIQVAKQTEIIQFVPVGAIAGLEYLVPDNATLNMIDCVWLVNNHMELDTYWMEY